MRIFALVGLLAASTSWAQQPPAPNTQQSPSQVQPQAPAAGQQQTIIVPAGTRIPAKLASPVTAKSGRPGDTVRAVTTFPVTVDTQLAIPAGTYIEGVIDKVNRRGPSGPVLLMHFTRILYGNGYAVPVDATNTQAKLVSPKESSPNSSAGPSPVTLATLWNSSLVLNQSPAQFPTQPLPSLQPLAAPPSHLGAIIGVAVASAVVVVLAIVVGAKHGGGHNSFLFDTGWQFEMVLQSPLSVDVASIATAVDGSTAQ
jgi:hypothetical protein